MYRYHGRSVEEKKKITKVEGGVMEVIEAKDERKENNQRMKE